MNTRFLKTAATAFFRILLIASFFVSVSEAKSMERFLVLPIDGNAPAPLREMLTKQIRKGIVSSLQKKGFVLVSNKEMLRINKSIDCLPSSVAPTLRQNANCVLDAGRQVDASYILLGNLHSSDLKYELELMIYGVSNKHLIDTVKIQVDNEASLLSITSSLSIEMIVNHLPNMRFISKYPSRTMAGFCIGFSTNCIFAMAHFDFIDRYFGFGYGTNLLMNSGSFRLYPFENFRVSFQVGVSHIINKLELYPSYGLSLDYEWPQNKKHLFRIDWSHNFMLPLIDGMSPISFTYMIRL